MYKILQQAGLKPDFVAGHSFGELTALWAAGVLSDEDYFFLVKARGQAMAAPKDPQFDAGAMLAVTGDVNQVTELIKNFPQVTIANLNSQHQVVLAGAKAEIAQVRRGSEKSKVFYRLVRSFCSFSYTISRLMHKNLLPKLLKQLLSTSHKSQFSLM